MPPSKLTLLPSTYKGLLFSSPSEQPTVASLPSPDLESGSVIIRPLYCWIPSYIVDIYGRGNSRRYPINFPVVGGLHAVGRVAALPPDARSLKTGDLVTVEPVVSARDGAYMPGAFEPGFEGDGTWAELVKVPLENALRIEEDALQRLNLTIRDIAFYPQLVVAYGGFRDVGLTAGETILISPATGNFGGAGVHVALAMGARVIAMGRNHQILAELKALAPGRVETVVMSGNLETDLAAITAYGTVDVFQDFTPPMATNLAHIQAGILSVRIGGRVNFMGNVKDLEIPYSTIMFRGLTIKGTLMYTRDQALELIKMIETGALRLGQEAGLKTKGVFKLEKGLDALEFAEREAGAGRAVYFAPNPEYLPDAEKITE
ncbi:alcohol dehydrogenase GroES domain-containing protein [Hypomontagnella submonticulosa]|nr:alcohol dehydrogenase GroES domain-containing protein [Hypomontagnella submonticulosa]